MYLLGINEVKKKDEQDFWLANNYRIITRMAKKEITGVK